MVGSLRSLQTRARRIAIDAYSVAVTAGQVDRRRLRRVAGECRLIVLNLHNVAPGAARFIRPIPPETFDELVGWVNRECRLTTFAGLRELPSNSDKPAAILSFDDGYRDFLEYAMPILERHGVRANQNVVAGSVDRRRPPWNVALLGAMEQVPVDRLRSLELPSGELPRLAPAAGDHALMRWGVEVSRLLKLRPRAEREPIVNALIEQLCDQAAHATQAMLTADDLVEVARCHELGVHSFEHDSMAFESDEFFAEDVRRCRSWYLERLGVEPRVYAFPNGSYRPSQVTIAREEGFEHMLLVGERVSSVRECVHPRITADGVTLRELRMRIARAC
jgi:peptidoglycan/xylan/chitin deacetylase (PgdA/CDA1 family)